ncbi:UDP-glucose/GDP-mannose dehydrogenase family protein [Bacillus sp. HMF5848]|uniref:UDP-glucose dehydrogenase family protein n=1 Tax=Bacillus sp. HMF5848 TaxID=2495421 RepID=UPI000F7A1A88|nr:UDP-glucose/GDP-mannose dehydrogenase family protein [Bacillus sp. HMF5848]RSK28673.1 UDP-glucose/GDP-mannose dehydrogenase family protein [Bacillus sp. HMF5848]
MKIAIAGTGYVGLVTGVCLSDIGHVVTCVDIDEKKVDLMKKGVSPIYEPGLDELMRKNIEAERLFFTTNSREAYKNADVIYIAVGTPEQEDGSANLSFVEAVVHDISHSIERDTIVVTKSTVPVGTNDWIKGLLYKELPENLNVAIVSNPEFLREGSAIYDAFNGDRIVIGTDCEEAASVVEEINKPYGIPIIKTDIRSAEMIKYASNAFLATKISFINEIANICEKVNANIEDVAVGIGTDNRIGTQFLKAGIGYGGSCFPKDTKALVQIAGNVEHNFELLNSVIEVNNKQQAMLVQKAKQHLGTLSGKRISILGLAFKPNTDDIREAASLVIAKELVNEGASVIAYDPIAIENTKKELGNLIEYTTSVDLAIKDCDATFIVTEWEEIQQLPLEKYKELMKQPILFDGRNCYDIKEAKENSISYISIGREEVVCKDITCLQKN